MQTSHSYDVCPEGTIVISGTST